MAWGYWNAHSLPTAKSARHIHSVGRSMSPTPTIQTRSRDQSIERDRREREQSACPTPARSLSGCPTPATLASSGGGQSNLYHHHHHLSGGATTGGDTTGSTTSPEHGHQHHSARGSGELDGGGGGGGGDRGYRTGSSDRLVTERNTLPRGKANESDGDWGAGERHTLPRGKSEVGSDAGGCWQPAGGRMHVSRSESGGISGGILSTGKSTGCSESEGGGAGGASDFCPACSSGSRVSFQSTKDSGAGGSLGSAGSDREGERTSGRRGIVGGLEKHDSKELLSSSLPTPPPPPFQTSFSQPQLSSDSGKSVKVDSSGSSKAVRGATADRKYNRQRVRDSCSSHDSHKSSASHRSSEEENLDAGTSKTEMRRGRSLPSRSCCKSRSGVSSTRTPSSERQFICYVSDEAVASKDEGGDDGYMTPAATTTTSNPSTVTSASSTSPACRYPCCPANTAPPPLHTSSSASRLRELESSSSRQTSKNTFGRDFPVQLDSRQSRIGMGPEPTGNSDVDKRYVEPSSVGGGGGVSLALCDAPGCNMGTTPSKNRWRGSASGPTRDILDLKKWRDLDDSSCFNGAQVWREPRGGGAAQRERIPSSSCGGTDSCLSPPRRSAAASETPDDDSVSFHETLGRELIRRRRERKRSTSYSSKGDEDEEEEEEEEGDCEEPEEHERVADLNSRMRRRTVRVEDEDEEEDDMAHQDAGRKTRRLKSSFSHSVTPGCSSRNSSSKSEKSSTRSSRSPSEDYNKKGCSSSVCRRRPSLR